ncbi:hypothetical protein [Bradyrhizobium ottawaense]|uniref:hypothetical protein n=1 Tax=Bradyrhizobium ottawaense TaxID=931866 RepID=UPI001BA9A543|nr:hypothetical protein [Bradyrhizobium ottawaense]MBR1360771.1 hypothetical protein [Bradyrhizobium ottawaense]
MPLHVANDAARRTMETAQTSRDSFDAYRMLEYAKFGNANDFFYKEVEKRLRQLLSLLKDVSALRDFSADLTYFHSWPTEQKNRFGLEQIERADRIELLTEAFYWIAHRASSALRRMPGLKSFEAIGVRDVRNWMLEHVDKPSGIRWDGFGWGGPAGPTLATVPYGRDKGLFVNAEEFFVEVQRVTSRCVKNPELIS